MSEYKRKPDILELPLQPLAAGQVGKLHGQAQSKPFDQYLAISPSHSLFHFKVCSDLELHGRYNGKPATFLTFDVEFRPEEQARPIRWASIVATFEYKEKDPDAQPLNVEAFALGDPVVMVNCTEESDMVRRSVGGNVGVEYAANVGGNASREHEISKELQFATMLSGSKYPSDIRSDSADSIRWILDGNPSQDRGVHSGVPPNLTLGVILTRANDLDFIGFVEVKIKADWKGRVEQWLKDFASFEKWGAKGRHKVYKPQEAIEGPVPGEVDLLRMEKLTEDDSKMLNRLVSIKMPKKYEYKFPTE